MTETISEEAREEAVAGVTPVTRTRHFIAGDPLRAVAALGVVAAHVVLNLETGQSITLEQRFGHIQSILLTHTALALYIFFSLSGYLIAGPFVRAYVEGRPAPRFWSYVERRLLRIVPAFWVAVTLSWLILGRDGTSWTRLLGTYGFVQEYVVSPVSLRFSQGWTLGVELGFYLLVPIFFALLAWGRMRSGDRTRRIVMVALFLVVVELFSIGLQHFLTPDHEFFGGPPCQCGGRLRSVPAMLFAFVPGIALVVAELALAKRVPASRRLASLALPFAALGVLFWVAYPALPAGDLGARSLAESLGAGFLVGSVLWHQWATGGAWRILDNRVMHWLGERSYSIYVVHFVIILEVLDGRNFDSPSSSYLPRVALALVAVIVAADLSYRLVERPLLNLKARRLGTTQAAT